VALKLAGAIYLIWLGIAIVRQRMDGHTAPRILAKSARRAFLESVAVEVLNPKTALFFVAFLPQFADPAAALPVTAQLLILGTVVNLAFSSADIVCVLLASSVVAGLRRRARTARLVQWAGGTLLVGLGLRLALVRD